VKLTTSQNIKTAVRLFLGILLLWAAVSKLANPIEFLGSIYAYQLPFPKSFLQLVAVVLPWLELLCGLMLLANLWTESALTAALGLFFVFVLATGQAWMRGLEISCGCFNLEIIGLSHDSHPRLVTFLESPMFAFFRNLGFTALTAYLFREKLLELKTSTEHLRSWVKPGKKASVARA
jgi:putative oxidoreductase